MDPSPLDWVKRLYVKLADQRKHARKYDPYYSGEHRLKIIENDFREVFGDRADSALEAALEPARVNLSRVAVEATTERQVIEGFRVGSDDNQAGADRAHEIWMNNDLDEMSGVAHIERAVKGTVFTLVWPDSDGDPVVSIEDPEQMVVARRMAPPYDIIAALKVWIDEWTGDEEADLYLEDFVYRFHRRRTNLAPTGLVLPWGISLINDWIPTTFDSNVEQLPNPYGQPPVVELANRARLTKAPQSDLVDVISIHDAADKLLADLIIAASFGAVPVRYGTGIKILADEHGRPVNEKGERITPMEVRSDRFLTSPEAASRFGTLEGSNLDGFAKADSVIMAKFRTVTRVPYHYTDMGGTSGVNGETLKALEGPLVRRNAGQLTRLGGGWRKTMQLCLAGSDFAGQPVVTRWADTETKSEAQQADAFGKLIANGTPFEIACEKVLGWDRELIRRALNLRDAEGITADAALAALQKDAIGGTPTTTVPVTAA